MLSIDAFAEKLGMGRSRVFQMTRPGVHSILKNSFSEAATRLQLTPDQLLERIGSNGSAVVATKPDADALWKKLMAVVDELAQANRKTPTQILTEALRRTSMPSKMRLVAKPMGPRGPRP